MSTEPELESYRSGVRVLGIVAIVVATLWLAAFALFALVGTLGGMGVLDPHESQGERMAGVAGSIVVCGLAALGATTPIKWDESSPRSKAGQMLFCPRG